jgi:hypothetical protein
MMPFLTDVDLSGLSLLAVSHVFRGQDVDAITIGSSDRDTA